MLRGGGGAATRKQRFKSLCHFFVVLPELKSPRRGSLLISWVDELWNAHTVSGQGERFSPAVAL